MQTASLCRVQHLHPGAYLASRQQGASPLPAPCRPSWGGLARRQSRGGAAWAAAAPPAQPPTEASTAGSQGRRAEPRPDDVVVVGACRTANCRQKKGGFKDTPADDLIIAVLQGVLARAGVQPQDVGDVCFGSVFPPSSKRASELRSATILAGFPVSVPAYTVNRQCAAGLQAIANAAAGIRAGYYDVAIAGGVESYTTDPLDWQSSDNPKIEGSQHAQDVGLALGLTAENIAERFGVPREAQDRWAAASHQKAAAAQAAGRFDDEIVPVETAKRDPATGEAVPVTVAADDSIRADTTPESLAKLKPYFKKGGTVTAGNACCNTDNAAAVLLMRREEAERRGLPVLATLRSFAATAVDPAIMGTAPLKAVPLALERAGLSKEDIDVFEINEAFASQFAYCMDQLGLPEEKVNPNGGAIALGHPAGATGARLTVTLLHELARRASGNGDRPLRGLVCTCAGSGQGAAVVFEVGGNGQH